MGLLCPDVTAGDADDRLAPRCAEAFGTNAIERRRPRTR
jgi:hypothetical protein